MAGSPPYIKKRIEMQVFSLVAWKEERAWEKRIAHGLVAQLVRAHA